MSWNIKKAELQRIDAFELWVLRKTLESPLNCKEIKPVRSIGNRCWTFIRRTDTNAEAPILWPPDAKRWLIGKDPDVGKDWAQAEKGEAEDEMAGCHHHSIDMNLNKLWEILKDREAWWATVHEVAKGWTWLSDWTLIHKRAFSNLNCKPDSVTSWLCEHGHTEVVQLLWLRFSSCKMRVVLILIPVLLHWKQSRKVI